MSRGSSGVWVAPPGMATGANVSTSGGGSAVGQRGSVQQETSQFLTQGNTPLGNGQSVGGPVRRACAASGAQWNVQVVKGKMTGKCLWNACKALSVGLLLMALGTAMATIGYYADRISPSSTTTPVIRGNHTVKVKPDTKGFQLNNLSYAGPIVMGVGGFIVVAACVMTFEARDSAAKVVPARFKSITAGSTTAPGCFSGHHRPGLGTVGGGSSRRSAASQTPVNPTGPSSVLTQTTTSQQHGDWDQQLGIFKASPTDRRALTAALQQFSRELGTTCGVKTSPKQSSHHLSPTTLKTPLNRSPSAPLLCPGNISPPTGPNITLPEGMTSPSASGSPRPSLHPFNRSNYPQHFMGPNAPIPTSARLHQYSLLSPAGLLKRHAVSVDESGPYSTEFHKNSRESLQGSQTSMQMDLHYPNDCPVTLRVKDTARRRMLTRQKPVEAVEESEHLTNMAISTILPNVQGIIPKVHHYHSGSTRRRSSNASDHIHHARKRRRDTSRPFLERAASTDARVMTHEIYMPITSSFYNHRASCSQETVMYSKQSAHRNSCIAVGVAGPSMVERHPSKAHCTTHRSSVDFRKQRSYSPKGSREVQSSVESKDNGSGNRSN